MWQGYAGDINKAWFWGNGSYKSNDSRMTFWHQQTPDLILENWLQRFKSFNGGVALVHKTCKSSSKINYVSFSKCMKSALTKFNPQFWISPVSISFTLLPDWLDSSHVCILWRSPSYCGETAGSRGPAWYADEGTANSVEVGSGAINKTTWYKLVCKQWSHPVLCVGYDSCPTYRVHFASKDMLITNSQSVLRL